MEKPSIKSVPGAFYDLIVYYASSIVFLFLIAVLLFDLPEVALFLSKLPLIGASIITVVAICTCYVYGQFASMVSAVLIKAPISRLEKWKAPKNAKDYFFDHFENCEDFPLLRQQGKSLQRNYWTIIYFIKIVNPDIADDLLKRYARCKLARVNAFNCLVLAVLMFSAQMVDFFSKGIVFRPPLFSGLVWSLLFALGTMVFGYEFYQRQCWFGDIVVKIYASVNRHLCDGQNEGKK